MHPTADTGDLKSLRRVARRVIAGVTRDKRRHLGDDAALLQRVARACDSPGRFPARNLIVAGQIALTAVLLIGAGLLIRSFVRWSA
jgi:hypothetical protein